MTIKTIWSDHCTELLHSLQHLTSEIQAAVWSFAHAKGELTVMDDDLLLQDTRHVILRSLWDHTFDLAHKGHQESVKTKSLLREKVLFPRIDSLPETQTIVPQTMPGISSGKSHSSSTYLLCLHPHGWTWAWIFVISLMGNIYWLLETTVLITQKLKWPALLLPVPLYSN